MSEKQLRWQLFPKGLPAPDHLLDVISVFEQSFNIMNSFENPDQNSNAALEKVTSRLQELGYLVETGKKASEKVFVPVLFGEKGKVTKYFEADAYSKFLKTVLEVEAGRAYANNQFLKDLFQASVMQDVDYCIIATRQLYKKTRDYEKVQNFLETLYSSNRLQLPLKAILLIGY